MDPQTDRSHNIPHAMGYVVQRSRSLAELLDQAVELIATEMETDVASIYLLNPEDHRLRLMATRGLERSALGKVAMAVGEGLTGRVVQEMRSIAVQDATEAQGYRYFPETREERFCSYLGVPLAIRNRPVGAIVVQTCERRAYTIGEVQALTTIAAQLAGVVENARLIDALSQRKSASNYFEEVRAWHSTPQAKQQSDEITYLGVIVSPGIAVGDVLLRGGVDVGPEQLERPFESVEAELARVDRAILQTRDEIAEIQEAARREADEEHALIFSSHLLLLNDTALRDRVIKKLEQSVNAERAISDTLEGFTNKLRSVADAYLRERIEDIWDLRSRLLDNLLPREASKSSSVGGRIVVTGNIAPSLVVELKAQGAKGIVAERGGPTSHGALLARSMGIPAVTGVSGILQQARGGQSLVLDGIQGRVVLSPSGETLRIYDEMAQKLASEHQLDLRFCHLPARSKDGVQVRIEANIGVSADLAAAREAGAQGIGLYRTEFPFMIREDFPTSAEQVRIYQKAYDNFPDESVTFRLLDLGGDKVLNAGPLEADRDPFRGHRSARVLLDEPRVLQDQVKAFMIAADARPLNILIPMVSTIRELRAVLKLIREAVDELAASADGLEGNPATLRLGAMIEVPAAVELAGAIAREVDFLSIGSNDLIQYTLAADRESARAAEQASPYHPAVLRMIRRTIDAGHKEGRPVSLCGELANHSKLAAALVAMGIDSLSLTPGAIPELKRRLASARILELRGDIDSILELDDAMEIREQLAGYLEG